MSQRESKLERKMEREEKEGLTEEMGRGVQRGEMPSRFLTYF